MSAGALIAGTPGATPVVLVHGLGGSSRVWDRIVPGLAASADIVAVHLESRGSIEDDAADVAALMSGPALVVGHSRGGLVATALAERHPGLVAALVLLCPPWSAASRISARGPVERALAVPVLGDLLWAAASGERRRAAQRSAFAPGSEVPDRFVADTRARGRADLVRSSRAIDDYLDTCPLPDRLRRLSVPVDLAFGALDQRVAAPGAAFADVAGARVTELPGVGHTPPWEAPDEVLALIGAVAGVRAVTR